MGIFKENADIQRLKDAAVLVLGSVAATMGLRIYVQILLHYLSPSLWLQAVAVLCISVFICETTRKWRNTPYYSSINGRAGLIMLVVLSLTAVTFVLAGLFMLVNFHI